MKAVLLAVAGTLVLGTSAFAAGSGPGSANNAPAQETQTGSQYGNTNVSGHAPGHEMGATTGSTLRSGPANGADATDAGPGAGGQKPVSGTR